MLAISGLNYGKQLMNKEKLKVGIRYIPRKKEDDSYVIIKKIKNKRIWLIAHIIGYTFPKHFCIRANKFREHFKQDPCYNTKLGKVLNK